MAVSPSHNRQFQFAGQPHHLFLFRRRPKAIQLQCMYPRPVLAQKCKQVALVFLPPDAAFVPKRMIQHRQYARMGIEFREQVRDRIGSAFPCGMRPHLSQHFRGPLRREVMHAQVQEGAPGMNRPFD